MRPVHADRTREAVARSVEKDRSFRVDTGQILSGAGWFGVATAASVGLEYATQVLIATRLGPDAFGLFSVGLQMFALALVVAVLALPNSAAYFIPLFRASGRSIGPFVSNLVWITAAGGILAGSALYSLAGPIAAAFGERPEFTRVVQLFALALPVSAMVALAVGVLRGLKESRQASLLSLVYERSFRLVLTILFLMLGFGLQGAVLAVFGAALLALGAGFRVLRRRAPDFRISWPSSNMLDGVVPYTSPVFLSQILTRATATVQPVLLLYLLDAATVGVYAIAKLVPQAFALVLGAFNFLYFPVISGSAGERDLARVMRIYRLTTSWSLLAVWPTYLLVMAVPEVFLGFMGPTFVEGAGALRILATAAVINVASGMVGSTLLATGKTRVYLLIEGLSVAVALAGGFLLIPLWGLEGAASSQLAAMLMFNASAMIAVHRIWHIHPFDRYYVRILTTGLVIFVPVWPLTVLMVDVTPWAVLAMALASTVATTTAMLKLNLFSEDSRLVLKQIGSRLRRVRARPAVGRNNEES